MIIDETPIEKMTPAQVQAAVKQLEVLRNMKQPSAARQTINNAEYARFRSATAAFLEKALERPACTGAHQLVRYADKIQRCVKCGRVVVA